jgi:pimeloyl-ACP methyl ester carboxylesterase
MKPLPHHYDVHLSDFRHCNAALQKSFTVVYWDQRGAGKSFDSRERLD